MTKSQQQEEMVNAFVSSIPTMQTDIALLKADTSILKDGVDKQSLKSDAILKRLDKLSVVSSAQFEAYKISSDARFKAIEDYQNDNESGVKFSNALVSRWTTFLVLLILTAAVIVAAGKFMPIGG